jgi:hypothetical protein
VVPCLLVLSQTLNEHLLANTKKNFIKMMQREKNLLLNETYLLSEGGYFAHNHTPAASSNFTPTYSLDGHRVTLFKSF